MILFRLNQVVKYTFDNFDGKEWSLKDVGQVCVMRSSMKGATSQDAEQYVIDIIPTVIKHTSMFLDMPASPEESKFWTCGFTWDLNWW